MLLTQRDGVFARRLACVGPLAEAEISVRRARRLAHDVHEHRHVVERAQIFLVTPVQLGRRIGRVSKQLGARFAGNTTVAASSSDARQFRFAIISPPINSADKS